MGSNFRIYVYDFILYIYKSLDVQSQFKWIILIDQFDETIVIMKS